MTTQDNIYPSHALVEKTILATWMQDWTLLFPYILRIQPVFFHVPTNQLIYEVMVDLVRNNSPFDELILGVKMKAHAPEYNWSKELEELRVWTELPEKLPIFAKKLEENFTNRKLVQVALQLSDFSITEDMRITQSIADLLALKQIQQFKVEESLSQMLKRFVANGSLSEPGSWVQTGFKELDNSLGYLEKKQLVVVGARPGMGKSAFLLSVCQHLLDSHACKILYVSLSMNPPHFLSKFMACRLNYPLQKITKGELPPNYDERLNAILEKEKMGQFKFHYQVDNDFTSLLAVINQQKIKHGLDVVIIDNLQMLDEPDALLPQNRNNTLGKNLRNLKQLAYEQNFLLLMGSDLSRSVERRTGFSYRPLLADLKDSGWIEELADKVLMIYRPEYYNLEEWEDGEPTENSAEIMVSKNNLGSLQNVRLHYNKETFLFSDDYALVKNEPSQWNIPTQRMNEF